MRIFALQESLELGRAAASHLGVMLDPVEERRFEDGEHKIRPMVSVRGEDVYIIQSLGGDIISSVSDRLCKLLFLAAACRENGAAQVCVVSPYLAYARKDRQTKPRDPVTLKYVAQLFEAMGMARIVTVEAHNVAAFQNAFRCLTLNIFPFPLFYPAIKGAAGTDQIAILSPDTGGMKRAQLIRDGYERCCGDAVSIAVMESGAVKMLSGVTSSQATSGINPSSSLTI